jgi:hypothetical protein
MPMPVKPGTLIKLVLGLIIFCFNAGDSELMGEMKLERDDIV